jgi:hypothetical protein
MNITIHINCIDTNRVIFKIDEDTIQFVVIQQGVFFSDTLSSSTPFKVFNQKIQTCNKAIIVTIKRR